MNPAQPAASSRPPIQSSDSQLPVYTEILVSKFAWLHVEAVISDPVPSTVYHTPGAVTDVPQKPASGSKVALVVDPLTVTGSQPMETGNAL